MTLDRGGAKTGMKTFDIDQLPQFAECPAAARASYDRLGFHVERGVLDRERCDRLVSIALGFQAAASGDYRPAMNPHRHEDVFLRQLAFPPVTAIIERLIGTPVCGLQSEFFYCRPGTRGFALHQDNFFVEAPGDAFASAWTSLTDISADMGSLIVIPGSHIAGRLPVAQLSGGSGPNQDPNAANEEVVLPPGSADPVCLPLPAGASVFLHAWVVHGSNANVANRSRYALLNTYIRKGAPFRPGNTAKRTALDLAGLADAV
ncbi:MAG TPA: phytanoyl-CoA dioxygenase family protein [Azospirillaceae bacterium]|nr:phytanoyl-CoA dioxygenase family protein [Azospirillaceae bacterium]